MGDRKKQLNQEDLARIDKGELVLSTIKTTAILGSNLGSYYNRKGYTTHLSSGRGGARGGGSKNTHTPSFSIKVYSSGYAYINAGGASGYVSKYNEEKKALLASPRRPLIDLYRYLMARYPADILEVVVSPVTESILERRDRRRKLLKEQEDQ
ncbi:MAG: hypothetical protein IKE45_04210 [Halomonas sp.]|nr:hypothetical protein [Halomonas sp.]MBR2513220.1 hypothetical protein [Halomonas sp.]